MAAELRILAKLQDDASRGIRALRGEVEGLGSSGGIAAKGLQGLQTAGVAVAAAITATAVAAAAFVKSSIQAGIEFESAFAGVVKTVDGVVDAGGNLTEFGHQLRDDFRQLAMEIPVSVNELAKIGELGGQLGVAGDDLIAFTSLIAQLGVTTSLSTEEAAMSFAQFGNIMQSSQEDLTRFGSAVVWLGNNFATTEADIVTFATRIAGAGAIAGMTEADLAGIGAAFSSVGVQAEAGGTAVQKVLLDMNTAVVTGGTQLEKYAQAAGMSAEQFAAAWRSDPSEAFTRFVEGLGVAGDEAILILDELGLADARLVRGFLSVAGAGDLLRSAIEGSNDAFAENMALTREAALRFQTVESQVQLFKNVINDVKIALYDALRPALAAILASLTTFVASVAPQVRAFFEVLGVVVGQFVSALLAGEQPVSAFLNALMRLGQELGVPMERLAALRGQIDGFLEAVGRVVGPIVQAVTSFVSWKDVMVALALALGSVVIPVIVAIVQAVAPVVLAMGALILAVAAVRTAFETNFLGIQTLAQNLWNALKTAIDGIKALLSGDTTTAMAAFRSVWETGWQAIVSFAQNAGSQIGQALAGLWQSIQNWFNGIDWAGLGRSLIEKFLGAMAALGQARADLWTWIITGLTNFINSVNWSQVGYTIVDLLGKAILGAVGLIATAVAGIVTFIWNFITGTDWIELGRNLVNAIIDGLGAFADGAGKKLGEWRDVIFDWAGAEDWEGVAQVIVEMVGEALADAAEAIGDRLAAWQEAIFDWAGAEDWEGVAQVIAEMVGEALADAAEAIGDRLATWREAIFDWAGKEDWQGVAEVIVEMVGEALSDMARSIGDRLAAWYDAIMDWVESVDWLAVGAAIVNYVLEGLTEFVDNVGDAVADWFAAVEQAIEGVDWFQLGYDIAFFIVDGLKDISEWIGDTLTGWLEQFQGATEGKSWDEIALQIIDAIVLGLQTFAERTSEIVSQWHASISGSVTSFLGAFSELGKNIIDGVISGVQAMAGALGDAIRGVIAGALGAGQEKAEAHSPARLFARELGVPISEGIAMGIGQGARAVIDAIVAVAGETELAGVKAFSDAMKGIGAAIESAIRSYVLLAGFGAADASGAATGLAAITAYMRSMVDGFVEANTHTAEALDLAGDFADLASDIVELVADSLLPLRTLAAIDTGFLESGRLASGLLALRDFLAGLVAAFAEAAAELGVMGPLVEAFADSAGTVVEMVGDALGAVLLLSGFNFESAVGGWHLRDQIVIFRNIIRTLIREFAEAASEFAYMSEAVDSFAEAAEAVVELVEDGLAATVMLSQIDFAGVVQGWHLRDQIVIFRNIVRTMVREFAEAALEFGYMSESVEAFADAAEAVVGLVEDGLAAVTALSAADFGTLVNGWHLRDQIVIFRNIIRTLIREFAEAAGEFGAMSESVEAFADAAGAVVDLVEPAFEAIEMLVSFTPVKGLQAETAAFAGQLVALASAIAVAFVGASEEARQALLEAVEFAGHAEDILAVVEPGIEALAALAAYTAATDIEAKAQQFTADLIAAMAILVGGLTQSAMAAGDALERGAAMAAAIGDLLDVVGPGVEALAALAAYTAAADIEAKATQFTGDLITAANALVAGLTAAANALGGPAVAAAKGFAADALEIIDSVRSALASLGEIAALPRPDIGPSLSYLAGSGEQIRQAFSGSGDIGTALGYAAAFRANLEQLVVEVRLAVMQLAMLAGTGTSGPVAGALAAIAAALMNTAGQFTGAGQALAAALINGLVNGIQAGTSAVVAAMSAMLNTVLNSATQSAGQFQKAGRTADEALAAGLTGGTGVVAAAAERVMGAGIAAAANEARRAGSVGQSAIQAIQSELAGGRSMLDSGGAMLGQSIVSGFTRSIAAGQSSIARSVSTVMNAAVAAARSTLAIASPSGVFMKLADFTVGGFVKNLVAGSRDVSRAVDSMMAGAVSQARGYVGPGGFGGSMPMPAASGALAGMPMVMDAGDVNVTIHIDGGSHSLADIKRQVEQAVSDAMRQQGRRADAMQRMR